MRDSGVVQVDRTDIGASDHYLVLLELGSLVPRLISGEPGIHCMRMRVIKI